MHVAHAGRESAGSLSSRTPALTRIHHRAGLSDERSGLFAEAVPPERGPPPRGRLFLSLMEFVLAFGEQSLSLVIIPNGSYDILYIMNRFVRKYEVC